MNAAQWQKVKDFVKKIEQAFNNDTSLFVFMALKRKWISNAFGFETYDTESGKDEVYFCFEYYNPQTKITQEKIFVFKDDSEWSDFTKFVTQLRYEKLTYYPITLEEPIVTGL